MARLVVGAIGVTLCGPLHCSLTTKERIKSVKCVALCVEYMEKLDIFDVKVVNGLEFRHGVMQKVNLGIDGLEKCCRQLVEWDFDVQDNYLYQKKKEELFKKCLAFKGMIDGYYDGRVIGHSVHRRMILELEQIVDKFK